MSLVKLETGLAGRSFGFRGSVRIDRDSGFSAQGPPPQTAATQGAGHRGPPLQTGAGRSFPQGPPLQTAAGRSSLSQGPPPGVVKTAPALSVGAYLGGKPGGAKEAPRREHNQPDPRLRDPVGSRVESPGVRPDDAQLLQHLRDVAPEARLVVRVEPPDPAPVDRGRRRRARTWSPIH